MDETTYLCDICGDNIENRLGYSMRERCPPGAVCSLLVYVDNDIDPRQTRDAVLPEVYEDMREGLRTSFYERMKFVKQPGWQTCLACGESQNVIFSDWKDCCACGEPLPVKDEGDKNGPITPALYRLVKGVAPELVEGQVTYSRSEVYEDMGPVGQEGINVRE